MSPGPGSYPAGSRPVEAGQGYLRYDNAGGLTGGTIGNMGSLFKIWALISQPGTQSLGNTLCISTILDMGIGLTNIYSTISMGSQVGMGANANLSGVGALAGGNGTATQTNVVSFNADTGAAIDDYPQIMYAGNMA